MWVLWGGAGQRANDASPAIPPKTVFRMIEISGVSSSSEALNVDVPHLPRIQRPQLGGAVLGGQGDAHTVPAVGKEPCRNGLLPVSRTHLPLCGRRIPEAEAVRPVRGGSAPSLERGVEMWPELKRPLPRSFAACYSSWKISSPRWRRTAILKV